MKHLFTIPASEGMDYASVLRSLSLHFEKKWRPMTNALSSHDLVVREPQTVFRSRRVSAFVYLRIVAGDGELQVEVRTPVLMWVAPVVLIVTASVWINGLWWLPIVVGLAFSSFPLLLAYAMTSLGIGALKRQIRAVIADTFARDLQSMCKSKAGLFANQRSWDDKEIDTRGDGE